MTEADAQELAWHRDWRRNVRSAFRLWLNATGYKSGCDTLQHIKDVLNEKPPSHSQEGERG